MSSYSENLRWPKRQLKQRAEKISVAMNVNLDPAADKEELANWLSIMEAHYEEFKREERATKLEDIEVGDEVAWTPFTKERFAEPVTGFVTESVQGDFGDKGFHLQTHIATDPMRLARLWCSRGRFVKTGKVADWKVAANVPEPVPATPAVSTKPNLTVPLAIWRTTTGGAACPSKRRGSSLSATRFFSRSIVPRRWMPRSFLAPSSRCRVFPAVKRT